MAESGSLQGSWWGDNQVCFDDADPACRADNSFTCKQLKLDLNVISPAIASDEGKPETEANSSFNLQPSPHILEDESAHNAESALKTTLLREQVERIHQLEKALDQSLASLEELRCQLVDQQFLEAQLASTEEISNIQQQAITHLKWQLAQQQQTLVVQTEHLQSQYQFLQDVLAVATDQTNGQPDQLERLREQSISDRRLLENQLQALQQAQRPYPFQATPLEAVQALVPQPFAALERSPDGAALETLNGELSAANVEMQALDQALKTRQTQIEQLETELNRAHIALQEQQAQIDLLQQAHTVRQSLHESPLEGELFTAQSKIQELETHLSRQMTTQAMLQHTCKELEQARDRYQQRVIALESQTAEMQEQILKQAQQASEYETAVQHWKDRYTQNQTYLQRLQDLIEQSVESPSREMIELLAQLQANTHLAEAEAASISVSQGIKRDVPDFLMRRQRYRTRP